MVVRGGQEGFTSVRASKDQSNPFDSRAQAETSNIFQRTSPIDVTLSTYSLSGSDKGVTDRGKLR